MSVFEFRITSFFSVEELLTELLKNENIPTEFKELEKVFFIRRCRNHDHDSENEILCFIAFGKHKNGKIYFIKNNTGFYHRHNYYQNVKKEKAYIRSNLLVDRAPNLKKILTMKNYMFVMELTEEKRNETSEMIKSKVVDLINTQFKSIGREIRKSSLIILPHDITSLRQGSLSIEIMPKIRLKVYKLENMKFEIDSCPHSSSYGNVVLDYNYNKIDEIKRYFENVSKVINFDYIYNHLLKDLNTINDQIKSDVKRLTNETTKIFFDYIDKKSFDDIFEIFCGNHIKIFDENTYLSEYDLKSMRKINEYHLQNLKK